ncbi:MAG: acyl-CoA reductase [Bacteroides thetaiotaomicron]|nr:acyl-CoA reductase [Bacteroides thetaiotaomicron]
MQLNIDTLNKVTYLSGSADVVNQLINVPALVPFNDRIVDFLNDVSKELLSNRSSKAFSDVVTFAFWIRRASVTKLKERFKFEENTFRLGKGIAFHIAPSNVPVNFAYSLVSGLMTGNANVVRVPSKDFPQVRIIVDAFNKALETHKEMQPYVLLVRYEKNKDINDLFSSIADVRIIWGGDNTISELRNSPLPPRSGEITFADRYSLAVIDSDSYLSIGCKAKVAEDFYNDTFFSDQNACTSPRIIVWLGDDNELAKKIFWEEEHQLAEKKYTFQPIQGVNKLTSSCLIAVAKPGVKVQKHKDNLIIRVSVPEVPAYLMDYRDNSGYFLSMIVRTFWK